MMDIEIGTVKSFRIPESKGLDVVNFYLQDIDERKGRIIIECYGRSWSSFWPSMGCRIYEFVRDCGIEYLVSNLTWGQKLTKRDLSYVTRIAEVVVEAIKQEYPSC